MIGERDERSAANAVIRGAVHHRQRAGRERRQLADIAGGAGPEAGVVEQSLRFDGGADSVALLLDGTRGYSSR